DRDPVDDHVVSRRLTGFFQDLSERLDQLPDRVIPERPVRRIVLLDRNTAREHRPPFDRASPQLLRRVLVLLVFEQPPDQFLARVELWIAVLPRRVQRLPRWYRDPD